MVREFLHRGARPIIRSEKKRVKQNRKRRLPTGITVDVSVKLPTSNNNFFFLEFVLSDGHPYAFHAKRCTHKKQAPYIR